MVISPPKDHDGIVFPAKPRIGRHVETHNPTQKMKIKKCQNMSKKSNIIVALLAAICTSGGAISPSSGPTWSKVVNNLDDIPGTVTKFNSYNQPSLNAAGLMVFRARSKGPSQPISGIFTKDLAKPGAAIQAVATRTTTVPAPNNTTHPPDDLLTTFIEFPSIPRIGMWTTTIATRGNAQPVWTYQVEGADTKAGTTGIYANPGGTLMTAVSLLGAVPAPASPVLGMNHFPYFAVPGAPPGTKFDVFPGSPSVTDHEVLVFKGNYTDGTGKTGVYFKDLIAENGHAAVQLIANTATIIPNLPDGVRAMEISFGSTAPPSAHGREMVFAGYDNEESPSYGGLYLAKLVPNPVLNTLIGLGDPVPEETNEHFTQFGEALAFDGRYVAFWGAWGTEMKTIWLDCPTDGNEDLVAYCRDFVGDNFPVRVPVHQGIFVHDTRSGRTHRMAQTGDGLDDFLFWTFSGRPPGVGESDESDGELPRWRASSFVAVSGGPGNTVTVAFKSRTGLLDPAEHNYINPVDGIYLANGSEITTLLNTTMSGQSLDPAAPTGSIISALSFEREGLRGRWLAVSATMLNATTTESLAGIYATKLETKQAQVKVGYYNGLVRHSHMAGRVSVLVSKSRAFSGLAQIGAVNYPFRGKFDSSGVATVSLKLRGQLTRQMWLEAISIGEFEALNMCVAANPAISTLDSDGALAGTALSAGYLAINHTALVPGRYTLAIPPNADAAKDSNVPQGSGYMVIAVNNEGSASCATRLGDWGAFTATPAICEDGSFSLYVRPYRNPKGLFAGAVDVMNVPGVSDIEGQFEWACPAQRPPAKRYSAGFSVASLSGLGSRYVVPSTIQGMLQLGAARMVGVTMVAEDLTAPIVSATAWVNVSANASCSPQLRTLRFSRSTGSFIGTVRDGGRILEFRGVVLQKLNLGVGVLAGPFHTGDVRLEVKP